MSWSSSKRVWKKYIENQENLNNGHLKNVFLGIRIMVGNNMRFVQILIMEENIEKCMDKIYS